MYYKPLVKTAFLFCLVALTGRQAAPQEAIAATTITSKADPTKTCAGVQTLATDFGTTAIHNAPIMRNTASAAYYYQKNRAGDTKAYVFQGAHVFFREELLVEESKLLNTKDLSNMNAEGTEPYAKQNDHYLGIRETYGNE